MAAGFLEAFLGALQASISVLLTIFYGAIAAQFDLLSELAAKDVSKACVRMFLPALLFTNLGSQLHFDTGLRYLPILIWAIFYSTASIALGLITVRVFKMPPWVTPALAFNNTTSLPLLLVQSLGSTNVLSSLLSGGDSVSDAIDRAKSYFLVNAMVSNSLTFALGPKLLHGQGGGTPQKPQDEENHDTDNAHVENGGSHLDQEEVHANEETSLLPRKVAGYGTRATQHVHAYLQPRFKATPDWFQTATRFLYQFANAPLIGAVLGAVVGLAPPLHRAFFNDAESGGVFNAWLTTSIKNIGDLFAALQILVVGVKLSQALRKMKAGKAAGRVPWAAMGFITFVRLVLWPAVSIPLVWAVAKKTGWLGNDPILWFTMMLMPTGPPALTLAAMAEVNTDDEDEQMSIAKFLTVSYAISPLICFSVVGSLKASDALVAKAQ